MLLEEVFLELKSVSSKVDALSSDVDTLKQKEKERESRKSRSRSRSRDPRHSPPRDCFWQRSDEGLSESWALRDPQERMDFSATINFSDEEDGVDGSQLVDVSEGTHQLLTTSCTRSVSNEMRKRTWSRYKLPKVDATRTPRVDHVMKTLASQAAGQTFMLDSLAPISALLENAHKMAMEDMVGPKHSERLRNRVCLSTMAVERATPSPPQSDSATACESGNHRALPKRGSNRAQNFALRQLSGTKERRCQRPVINLKNLNSFVVTFKMEGIHTLKSLLRKGDWLVKIDLKDAYFSIPISQKHKKFLCF